MAMKMEDEVKHMAEVLNIKIELSNAGTEVEVKETMEITEKIKRAIEESFGKESGDVTVKESKGTADATGSFVQATFTKIEDAASMENAETDAPPVDVIQVDYSSITNEDYDDIAEPESDHDSLELEELTDDASARSKDNKKETDEKLKLFNTEMKKLKHLPLPGSRKSSFERDIRNAFEKLLPSQVLDKLTTNRCGLCHEDFTSERFAWKHYTGYNHKRTVRYFINGTYKDHPSFYNMVLDAVHSHHPAAVTEKQIFDYIKKEHPVGDDDSRTMSLVRQRGLDRLLQIEYVVNKDGLFSATQALLNRKMRSKQLLERTDSAKVEPVKNLVKNESSKLSQSDSKHFREQIFDFSKKDLPKSVIDTLTPENCGLCHLQIYCKPWSHYTGAGHRTTVELYQSGSYLGHPPYPTMVEKYLKEVKPASLDESDIVDFLKKNFNIGEDMEKVKARVEKCVGLLKKKDSSLSKMKFPSDNLVWFKKDASGEKNKSDKEIKLNSKDKKELKDENKTSRQERGDDGSKNSERRHLDSSKIKEQSSSQRQYSSSNKQRSTKRKSSPGYPDRGRHLSEFKKESTTTKLEDRHRNDARSSGKYYDRPFSHEKRSPAHLGKSDDRRRGSPMKRRSHEKQARSSVRQNRSPIDSHRRSPRRKERSPETQKTSSRSYKEKSGDLKRYRKSSESRSEAYSERSGPHQRNSSDVDQRNSRSDDGSSSRYSKQDADPRSKDQGAKPHSSSSSSHRTEPRSFKSPNNKTRRSSNSSNSARYQGRDNQDTAGHIYNSRSRPRSRDSLSNLTNPSPPPGFLPPDLIAAPNPAMPAPVMQPQMPFPASFLTQHPQFPHVFILNTMGGQMGSQMGGQMMSVPLGQQQTQPNQPPTPTM
eukprot:GFUD01034444.1.p1 GENE.GFUD01034444.1~~GFUD01034444.1.p1  ORF type:complete len:876 (-),score=215.44 GFUD01034444.1:126-2753(-)